MRYDVVQSGSGWAVKANGRRTSKHRTQSNAINAARDRADAGDDIYVHGRNGKVRDVI